MAELIKLTDKNFDDSLAEYKLPVMVEFWADWCGPCRMLKPILEQLADEFDGRLLIARVNLDENPILVKRYNIRSMPNMILFKASEAYGHIVGAFSKAELKAKIENYL